MRQEKPILRKENAAEISDLKFLRTYDYQYFPGRHYYVCSRRPMEELAALKDDREFRDMIPDAVSCVVIVKCEGREPLLCLTKEFRYSVGQFLLSVPAGLIDDEDRKEENPVFSAAKRELLEETGIALEETDEIKWINPLLLSTPGMTDESNAIVQITLNRKKLPAFSPEGAVGGECFDGYVLVDQIQARKLLREGRDEEGVFYSAFTWIGLMSFVSGLWEE